MSRRAPLRATALAIAAILLVPIVGGSGAWFTDSRAMSGSASAATLGAVSPAVAAAGAGNAVSWSPATDQPWATGAGVAGGVTYAVQRQVEGRPAQVLGTTSGASFADPGGQPFGSVSAGLWHSLAVASDGSVWAWGIGENGRLGTKSTADSSVPVKVWGTGPGGVVVVQVSAGDRHSLALASDGTVWAWGFGGNGQLGTKGSADSSVPVKVSGTGPGGVVVAQVSAGAEHSLAVASDGSVWAWGLGAFGRLGTKGSPSSFEPVEVWGTGPGGVVVAQVSAGYEHSLAVASDGSVWAWGAGGNGRLGTRRTADSYVPVKVSGTGPGGTVVAQVSAGHAHSLAVASDGAVWAWGAGASGRLGNGGTADSSAPVKVSGTGPGGVVVAQASAGAAHSLALASDGSVRAWGAGGNGRLGTNSPADSPVPAMVSGTGPGGAVVAQVSAGGPRSLAVASDGAVRVWGSGAGGQLGINSSADQWSPVLIGQRTFAQVSAGDAHSLGLASDGSVWAWGSGANGRLGNGGSADSSVPVKVPGTGPGGVTFTQVSAGESHSLGLASDGSVWAWGSGANGRLGNGGTADSPVPVAASGTGPRGVIFTQVSAGGAHSVGRASDGSVWSWGRWQRASDGKTASVPTKLLGTGPGGVEVTQVSAGAGHSLALASDGSVWAWGDGGSGQLGRNSKVSSSAPVPVSGMGPKGVTAVQVSAGGLHSMAVVSDGSVWAWGYGWNGQLGRNSTDDSWVPVRVWGTGPAGTTFSAVSAGFIHSVGVASDGSLWSWGHFDDGRLGIDRKDDVLVPLRVRKAVSGGDALRQVSAGGSHTLMSTSDGSAWAWGRGANGRLGDNGTTSTSVPTRVRPLSPTLLGANCAPPATLIGQRCTLPGTTTYSVSYRYLGWSSPLATATITR